MATKSIRWAAAEMLVTLLRAHPNLSTTQIEPGFPGGKKLEREAIWLDEIFGDQDLANIKAGRRDRNDVFSLPLEMRVAGLGDLDSTMSRLNTMQGAIEDVLADDASLGSLGGVIMVEITSERMTAGETPDSGVIGFAEVVVSVTARYE